MAVASLDAAKASVTAHLDARAKDNVIGHPYSHCIQHGGEMPDLDSIFEAFERIPKVINPRTHAALDYVTAAGSSLPPAFSGREDRKQRPQH